MPESWEKAVELEIFINMYVPKGWVIPIGNVCHRRWLLPNEYEDIAKGIIPDDMSARYYREAIEAYFKKNAGTGEVKNSP